MRRLLLSAGMILGLCGTAQATLTIHCVSEDGAELHLGVGNVPVMSVIGASIETQGTSLSTQDGTIGMAHGFWDAETIRVDFADAIVNEMLARLRLFRASAGRDHALAGTLEIIGRSAHAVICEGP